VARKVFFSFHYERDVWRVSQVRNSQTILSSFEETQFLDKAHWEQVKAGGQGAIQRWIDNQLIGTSCTIVLIGNATSERQWVHYEISKSWEGGSGLFGIYIHDLQNSQGFTDRTGLNPFNQERFTNKYGVEYKPRTYNWVNDNGRSNVANWIELAINDRK
jgi:hypothetical protein